ncbi:MAG: prepilin-type N-terminal cleavage/methylation domain-containing protein [Candidatus Omnitrophica bacterium]|nr:prepilin-type N-terminal cleavage/methylation domain-containing protein [Candidatus Omnitrophota bacterium]
MREKSFTLVELMISVTILSLGIVMVTRSLLGSASALDATQNRIDAARFLDGRMAELQIEALKSGGVKIAILQEDIKLNSRQATYRLDISALQAESEEPKLNRVDLALSWKESNVGKDEFLSGYLPNKN